MTFFSYKKHPFFRKTDLLLSYELKNEWAKKKSLEEGVSTYWTHLRQSCRKRFAGDDLAPGAQLTGLYLCNHLSYRPAIYLENVQIVLCQAGNTPILHYWPMTGKVSFRIVSIS